MHYYKRNLGDYAKKAGRLSMLEHGAYTLLIDACYDREQFPTLAEALDWAWARTEAEEAAVKFVLSKFFTLIDGVYVQNRIKEELDEYKAKADTNARIAKEREEKRKNNKQSLPQEHESARTVNETCEKLHETPPNHKPITNNQEPIYTAAAREEIFKEPTDDRPKFKMHLGWQLSPSFLTDRKGYGFNPDLLNDQVLAEFCGFWMGKNEKLTQGEWEHKFATNLVKLTKTPLATGTVRKSNIPNNNTVDWMSPELVAMLEAQGEHAN